MPLLDTLFIADAAFAAGLIDAIAGGAARWPRGPACGDRPDEGASPPTAAMIDTLFIAAAAFCAGLIDALVGGAAGAGRGAPRAGIGPTKAPRRRPLP